MAFARRDPRDLARAAYDKADLARLEAACASILARAPDDVEARRLMGRAHLKEDRPDRAEPWFREAAAREPGRAGVWTDLARALFELKREDEAEAILAAAAQSGVRSAALWTALGRQRLALSRAELARTAFEAAVETDEGHGDAWMGLAACGALSPDEPRARALAKSLEAGALAAHQAAGAAYALGEAAWRAGDVSGALARWAKANALELSLAGSRRDRLAGPMKAAEKLVTRSALARAGRAKPPPFTPLFVVGAPGAEAVARLLARHPGVIDAGAPRALPGATARMAAKLTGAAFPEGLDKLASPDLDAIAAEYADRVAPLAPNGGVVLDANPDNAHLAGAVALLFPGARMVRVDRDPMDAGLAVWRARATPPGVHANDMGGLARRLRRTARLDQRARAALPGVVTSVRLEALAADPEEETARLLKALDLDPAPGLARDFAVAGLGDGQRAEKGLGALKRGLQGLEGTYRQGVKR